MSVIDLGGDVCKCDAPQFQAYSIDSYATLDFGPILQTYIGYPAEIRLDGPNVNLNLTNARTEMVVPTGVTNEKVTINGVTQSFTPVVGKEWIAFGIDGTQNGQPPGLFAVFYDWRDNVVGMLNETVICDVGPVTPGVPEPGTWLLLAIGMAALALAFHNKRKVANVWN